MYKRILIAVSTVPTSQPAVVEGVALARSQGAEVVFVYVLPRYVMPVTEFAVLGMAAPEGFQRESARNAQRDLDAAKAVAEAAGVRSHSAIVSGPDDVQCIVEVARKRRCGLIVVASAGRNAVMRMLAGSVIPGLITHATLPVLVVRRASAAARQRREAAPAGRKRTARTSRAQAAAS